jgi:hypothetical protein
VRRDLLCASNFREKRMDARRNRTREQLLPEVRERRLVRTVIFLFEAMLAVGAWQGYGVLIYGIEGSYAR